MNHLPFSGLRDVKYFSNKATGGELPIESKWFWSIRMVTQLGKAMGNAEMKEPDLA